MTTQKTYRKTLCFLYILILLLWGVCSGASSIAEITESFCSEPECYVNYSAAITSAGRHLPAQEYLSVRNSNPSESLSDAGNRSQRHLTRSVRQIATYLYFGDSSEDLHALFGLLSVREIPAHSPCSIIITNYIHHKDGQKS